MTPQELETLLCDAYQRKADLYTGALETVEGLLEILRVGRTSEDHLRQLHRLLAQLAAVEAGMVDARERWEQMGLGPGFQFQALLGRTADLIDHLARRIAEAGQEAETQKNRLAPELNALALGRLMRRAYSAVADRPSSSSLIR